MFKNSVSGRAFLVCIILLGFFISSDAAAVDAQTEKPLTIAITGDYPPFTVVAPNGEPTGLVVEMWRFWSKITGIPIQFRITDLQGTLEGLRSGEADIHSGLFRNKSRAEWMAFSEPIHEIKTGLFFKTNGPPPRPLDAMVGSTVGTVKDYYQQDYLLKNYPDIIVKPFKDGKELVLALLNGEVDAILNEIPAVEADLARFALRGSLTHGNEIAFSNLMFAGVLKGKDELINLINDGFSKIPVKDLALLESLWLPDPDSRFIAGPDGDIHFTPQEEKWLADHPVIRIGVTTFIKPVDIVDEAGNYSGLNADLIALLNQKIGANIVPEFHDKWGEVVSNAMSGKVDAALSLSRTPERERHLLFTRPYAYDPIIVVVPQANDHFHSWEDLKNKRVVAVKGMAVMDDLKSTMDQGTLILAENETEALKVLQRGEAEAFVGFLIPYGNAQRNSPIPGMKIVVTRNTEGGSLRIGVPRNRLYLFSILRKGLSTITREEMANVRNRWLYPKEQANIPQIDLTDQEKRWLARHPMIRIGVDRAFPPFEFVDNNSYQGIAPEYLKLIGERLGIEFKVAPGLTWEKVLAGLKNRTVDMAPIMTNTEKRRQFLDFTKPYLSFPTVIFTRNDFHPIEGLSDLAGKSIAIPKGHSDVEITRKKYPNIKIVTVNNVAEALNAVVTGKAQAAHGNFAVYNYFIQENNITNLIIAAPSDVAGGDLSMGVRNDWPEFVAILEKALASITRTESQTIRRKWVADSSTGQDPPLVDLTLEERRWLKKNKNFRLGIDPSWAPFEFINEQGEYSGISSGYVDLIRTRLGISLVPKLDLSWAEAMEQVQLGRIDVISTLVKTPKREKFLNFTNPYTSFPMVITTRKDAPYVDSLDSLDDKKVGVVKGYVTGELIKESHETIKLVPFKNLLVGLQALNKGEIDAFVDNLMTITHAIDRSKLNDLKIAAPTEFKIELSMGVRKDLPELVPILNKALGTITERDRSAIVNTWTAIQVNLGTDLKTIVLWATPIILVVLIIIALIIRWNRRLGREVFERKQAQEGLAKERELLETVLGSIQQGLVAYDKDLRLIISNRRFSEIREVPEELTIPGTSFSDLIRHDVNRGEFGPCNVEEFIAFQTERAKEFKAHHFDRIRPNGTVIKIEGAPLPGGGFVSTFSDITARKKAEAEEKLLQAQRDDALHVISGSIQYASRIQRSILPAKKILDTQVADYFVVWEPRDTVGGDMYWCRPWADGLLIMLGDCTGHGVPGAFMTLISNGALDEAYLETPPGNPAILLQRVHQHIQISLGQDQKQEAEGSDDGIEIGACFLSGDNQTLTFAGARFELFILEDGEISIIKGVKAGLGYRSTPLDIEFVNHTIDLSGQKTFYMTSDGLIDQIGGEKNRGFGKRRFTALLTANGHLPLSDQKERILKTLSDYQDSQKRRDDLSIIGFKSHPPVDQSLTDD
ncbi:MAG: transporter substrate-binding domain-containing protein [Magnetococcales bacterium]|nr:transporter substrate-binding domain-containing protein [Magnetococcales bacterium]